MEKKEANGKKLESRDSGVDVGGANESKSGVSTAVFKARSRRVQRYPFPKSAPVEHKEKADDVLVVIMPSTKFSISFIDLILVTRKKPN